MASRYQIAYLRVAAQEDGAFIGGALVVGSDGLPLEFRYTDRVVPTPLQRVLMGKSLPIALKGDAIGAALLKDLKEKSDVVIIDDVELFTLEPKCPVPIVYLAPVPREPLGLPGDIQHLSDEEILLQLHSLHHPVRVRLTPKRSSLFASIRDLLLQMSEDMDLLEPLQRLGRALEMVSEKDSTE